MNKATWFDHIVLIVTITCFIVGMVMNEWWR
jgi:hypothetical protein